MAFVSVSEAARLVGRNRTVIYRDYIDTGRLSATKDAKGRIKIDTSELIRVFGSISSETNMTEENVSMLQSETQNATAIELEKLRQEVAILKEKLASKEEIISEKEKHLEDVFRMVALLEDNRKKKRWWHF